MNPFFNWLKDSGTQAMLVLVGAVGGIIAAVGTIYFGRKSLTKKDLASLEDHTAPIKHVHTSIKEMDDRQDKQEALEQLTAGAKRVHISISGSTSTGHQMPIMLSTIDKSVTFRRLEFLNETDNLFGTISCVEVGNGRFQAIIDWGTFMRWWSGGTKSSPSMNRLVVRVWMAFHSEGQLVESSNSYRDMAVSGTVRHIDSVYTINGRVW